MPVTTSARAYNSRYQQQFKSFRKVEQPGKVKKQCKRCGKDHTSRLDFCPGCQTVICNYYADEALRY